MHVNPHLQAVLGRKCLALPAPSNAFPIPKFRHSLRLAEIKVQLYSVQCTFKEIHLFMRLLSRYHRRRPPKDYSTKIIILYKKTVFHNIIEKANIKYL